MTLLPAQNRTHVVKGNETLDAIAERYHVSVEDLFNANPVLEEAGFGPGMSLVIPAAGAKAAPAKKTSPSPTATSQGRPIIHKVAQGETLKKIAKKYGITVELLEQFNPQVREVFVPGMRLVIPVFSDGETPTPPTIAERKPILERHEEPADMVPARADEPVMPARADESAVLAGVSEQAYPVEPAPSAEPAPATAETAAPTIRKRYMQPVEERTIQADVADQAFSMHSENNQSQTFMGSLLYSVRDKDGDHRLEVMVCGNDLHITDVDRHIHTVMLPFQGVVYVYSDLTRKGKKFNFQRYNAHYNSLYTPRRANRDRLGCDYDLKLNERQQDYLDLKCNVYNGVISGNGQTTKTEIWAASEYNVPPVLSYVFGNLSLYGLPARVTLSSGQYQLQSYKVQGLSLENILPSKSIHIEDAKHLSDVQKIYDANAKKLRRR